MSRPTYHYLNDSDSLIADDTVTNRRHVEIGKHKIDLKAIIAIIAALVSGGALLAIPFVNNNHVVYFLASLIVLSALVMITVMAMVFNEEYNCFGRLFGLAKRYSCRLRGESIHYIPQLQ
jgi:hypothetical protein